MSVRTLVSAGLTMLGFGAVLVAVADAPELTSAGIGLGVLGVGFLAGAAAWRWGR